MWKLSSTENLTSFKELDWPIEDKEIYAYFWYCRVRT